MQLKRLLLIGAVVFLLVFGGVFFWARAVLAGPAVKNAVAAQMSETLGQPVTIGALTVNVFPRVTVNVEQVQIGEPAAITVAKLHIGTGLRALLSKRIEHADLQLDGAKIALPLPPLGLTNAPAEPAPAAGSSELPVEIVSIDEVNLRGVEITSGGRTITGDIELVPHGVNALTVKRVSLGAGEMSLNVTGEVSDIAAMKADLDIDAGTIDVDALSTFFAQFASAGSGSGSSAGSRSGSSSGSGSALVLTQLKGHAVVSGDDVKIDKASFGLFGGEGSGVITLTNSATPAFSVDAQLTGVDMAAAMAFAGSPGTVTGRANGRMDISGRGLDADDVMRSVTGTLRLDVADGVVKGLGLVKTIVLAGSGRDNALEAAKDTQADEPFKKMAMTLALGGGAARTDDLTFQSDSVLLSAAGTLALDGSDVDLAGNVQLSEALTQQAGRTLVAYTQQDGRVTIPVTVTGSAENLHAMVAVGDLMKRAATNKAKEEAAKALKKGLGRIIKR
jgi:uncharacterized protein involved in outer membrane biogenesis